MFGEFHNRIVFDGEPAAGAGTTPDLAPAAGSAPNEAASPADAGQQITNPPASAPAPADGSEAPADADGNEPPKDGEAPKDGTVDLPDLPAETLANLIEAYGEKWREHPTVKGWLQAEVQQTVQAQQAEAQRRPDADPMFIDLTAEAGTAYDGVLALVRKMDAGEDVNPQELARHVATTNEFTQAAERRASVKTIEDTLTDVIVSAHDGKVPEQSDPIHKAVDEARANYQKGLELANRMRRNPQTHARAAEADRAAVEGFAKDTLKLVFEAGQRSGEKRGATKTEKQTNARVALAKDNALKEAIARAGNGRPPPAAPGGTAGEPTYAQVVKMSKKQIEAIPDDVYERIISGGTKQ